MIKYYLFYFGCFVCGACVYFSWSLVDVWVDGCVVCGACVCFSWSLVDVWVEGCVVCGACLYFSWTLVDEWVECHSRGSGPRDSRGCWCLFHHQTARVCHTGCSMSTLVHP